MNADDEELIRRYAAGDDSMREKAVELFQSERKVESSKPRPDCRRTPAMRFMAEVDNPCPDYALRRMYRDALVATAHLRAKGS